MSALLTLVERELVRFYRQRSRVIGALLTPLLFWLLIGGGLGRSFQEVLPGDSGGAERYAPSNYLHYFFPGVLVMIVLFTAIFSTISVIEDRREGFLQGVLVAPVSRFTVAGGKIAGGTILAVGQAALFLLVLGGVAGVSLNPTNVPALLLILTLLAIGLTGLGFTIAWLLESTQGFHAIMNLFLVPLWILSGAAFPASGAHPLLRAVMTANPVTYGVAGIRHALFAGTGGAAPDGLPGYRLCLLVLVAFAVGMTLVAGGVVRFRRTLHG